MKQKDHIVIPFTPYPGKLYVARTLKAYLKLHARLYGRKTEVAAHCTGRANSGPDVKGDLTHLIWAKSGISLLHEINHSVLFLFDEIGSDPRAGNGEPFCYMTGNIANVICRNFGPFSLEPYEKKK